MRNLVAAVFLSFAALPAAAQPAEAPSAAPQTVTVAETAASRFIEAFNAPGSLKPFIAANFTQVSLSRQSAALRAAELDRVKAAAGGMTRLESKSQGERMVETIAATRNGGKHVRIVLFTSGREPGKIADIFILDARDPKRAAADAFPTTAVSERD